MGKRKDTQDSGNPLERRAQKNEKSSSEFLELDNLI